MQNLALAAPLIILFPSIGAFINFFWGDRLNERYSALIATVASGMSFVIALILLSYLSGNYFQPAIVNPPLIDGSWISIDAIGLDITWQMRVDTLSVTMMLFVTFVGTFIHIYSAGYMHGDPKFSRFFAYLNMFLAFMLILVTGNNFVMMFVGWEGVGLCSYLLISFWWDKPGKTGWNNSNAGRKAFIANRVGDFGLMVAMFLIFWAFGTLDFYKPTELPNPSAYQSLAEGGDSHGEDTHSEEAVPAEEDHGEETEEHSSSDSVVLVSYATQEDHGEETEAAADDHSEESAAEEGGHGGPAATLDHTDNEHLTYDQLGVFERVEIFAHLDDGETVEIAEGQTQGRTFDIGGVEMDIELLLVIITLFLLLGATGKSAQIPLFVWLPDAMAGPTPASSLIHAATMVTSGVYMMVRANSMFYNAEFTSLIVTIIGVSTALVGGFIALGQYDIKRVLAYSTVSQLGFMVAAVGLGGYVAAIFHMITHAFFKAMLFMGSGSVIHGVEHGHHHVHEHGHGDDHGDGHHDEHFDPQDMRNMGGLRKKMPFTYWTYVFGTLALAGIFPFAGFWSKDEILADAWGSFFFDGTLKGVIALGGLLIAAALTAFYMWRQIEMVFHGTPRSEAAAHAPESSRLMVIPLIVLAFFSLTIWVIQIPSGLSPLFVFWMDGPFGHHMLGDFLEYSLLHYHLPTFQPLLAMGTFGLGLFMIFMASRIYGGDKAQTEEGKDPLEADENFGPAWGLANARLYWDDFYERVFIQPYHRFGYFLADVIDWQFLHDYFHDSVLHKGFNAVGYFLANPIDVGIIDGVVNGLGYVTRKASGIIRQPQSGYVRVYAVLFFFGVVAIVVLMLLPMIQG